MNVEWRDNKQSVFCRYLTTTCNVTVVVVLVCIILLWLHLSSCMTLPSEWVIGTILCYELTIYYVSLVGLNDACTKSNAVDAL